MITYEVDATTLRCENSGQRITMTIQKSWEKRDFGKLLTASGDIILTFEKRSMLKRSVTRQISGLTSMSLGPSQQAFRILFLDRWSRRNSGMQSFAQPAAQHRYD
jgi:hypothetical protein